MELDEQKLHALLGKVVVEKELLLMVRLLL